VVVEGRKEILRIGSGVRRVFDLTGDPSEEKNLVAEGSAISAEISNWLEVVQEGLAISDELPAPMLSAEQVERLRALGYLD
jgi:hypothetical protein